MTGSSRPPPLRVEQALRLLPDVDALMPLRSMLVSASRTRPPVEPYRTVGKRLIHPRDLRGLVPQAVERVRTHLLALYDAAVSALEAEQRGDQPAVVAALLRAGAREEDVGRETPAHAWYEHALAVAEELRERQPEIMALLHLGRLDVARGRFEQGGRHFQRGLVLAEAEHEHASAAAACRGLGAMSIEEDHPQGAEAWFTRALRYAEGLPVVEGDVCLDLADVARRQHHLDDAADRVVRARAAFDRAGDAAGRVRALDALAVIEGASGRWGEALSRFGEALAGARALGQPRVELGIRLHLCQLHVDAGRLPDAEDEARGAEEMAIAHSLTRPLARLYVMMGTLRGQQGDETGFVFFEKAIELCRGSEPSPRLEAEVYLAYGRFRQALGDAEEARACTERAHEILQMMGALAEPTAI